MGASDLSPDNTELRSSDGLLGLVDVCDSLAEVEFGSLGVLNTFDLQKGGVVVGVAASSLESDEGSLDVQSTWL